MIIKEFWQIHFPDGELFYRNENCLLVLKNKAVFIDLRMSGKNGADFIYYLNSEKKFSCIKKVVVTETGMDTLLKTSLEKEVDAYLHKEEVFKDY